MKTIKQTKEFDLSGDFESHRAAENWLHDRGYSTGSMDGSNPIAIVKGEYNFTQKWHNFTKFDKELIDGILVSNRNGKAKIVLYND